MSGKGLNGSLVAFLACGLREGDGSNGIGALRRGGEAFLESMLSASSWRNRRGRGSTDFVVFLVSVPAVWELEPSVLPRL